MNAPESNEDRLDDALAAHVASLRRELRPPHDAWSAIAARVSARRRRPLLLGGSAAAAMVTAALLLQTSGLLTVPATDPAPTVAVDPAVQQGIETLLAGRVDLSTMTVAMLRANVALFDRALHDLTAALELDPSNAGLQRQLLDTYQGQIELLETIRRAARG